MYIKYFLHKHFKAYYIIGANIKENTKAVCCMCQEEKIKKGIRLR